MSKNYQKQLKKLIRGEMSAVEAYDQILKKFKDEITRTPINEMRDDHVKAVNELEGQLTSKADEPSGSGPWGGFTRTFVGTAKLLGDKTALRALREGEEHGRKQYLELLKCDDIPSDVEKLVKENYIPKQQNHIDHIDKMIKAA